MRIAEHLAAHGVEFLVIGGQAAALYGSPIPTYDVDLCYRRRTENLRRLAEALRALHPTLRGAPADWPFRLDAESLALGSNFTFHTDLGPVDLLGGVEPLRDFDVLTARAAAFDLESVSIQAISLADLISVKRHLRRPKDQAALLQLESLSQLPRSNADQ